MRRLWTRNSRRRRETHIEQMDGCTGVPCCCYEARRQYDDLPEGALDYFMTNAMLPHLDNTYVMISIVRETGRFEIAIRKNEKELLHMASWVNSQDGEQLLQIRINGKKVEFDVETKVTLRDNRTEGQKLQDRFPNIPMSVLLSLTEDDIGELQHAYVTIFFNECRSIYTAFSYESEDTLKSHILNINNEWKPFRVIIDQKITPFKIKTSSRVIFKGEVQ